MTRFRALLVDPGNANAERPVQTFANNPAVIDDWAQAHLRKAVSPTAHVDVFIEKEEFARRIDRVEARVK